MDLTNRTSNDTILCSECARASGVLYLPLSLHIDIRCSDRIRHTVYYARVVLGPKRVFGFWIHER